MVTSGLTWNMADGAYGGDFSDYGGGGLDWYDAGDYLSPTEGGYPGGIPGYDDYAQGTTGPVSPEVPYDPYADEGPSQPTAGVPVNPRGSSDDTPEITVIGDRPPAIPNTPVVPDLIQAPNLELPDLTPYLPVEDVPEMVIKGPRPQVTLPDTTIPLIPPGDILQPIPPVEEDVPEMVIKDTRPSSIPDTPVVPDIIPPGNIDITIPETPVTPEPPVVTPPVIQTPVTPVTPVVTPPVVTPPVVTPPVVQTPVTPTAEAPMGLNPGFIRATPFYNTTNPAQAKYYWGQHGYQYGPTFNAQAWNQAAAPETPWGLGQVATPLTGQQITDLIQGRNVPTIRTAPATRVEAYKEDLRIPPASGQVFLPIPGTYAGMTAPSSTTTTTTAPTATTKETYTADQKAQISGQLGNDWQTKIDDAARAGDYATVATMQNQINSILNPVYQGY